MTTTQKIALRLSEVRTRLNEVSGLEGDDFTQEVRAESEKLTKEYGDLESRHRAAIVSEGEPIETRQADTGEGAELRQLISKANISGIFDAALGGAQATGAEAELQKELKLDGNSVPLALLRRHDDGDVELRTTGVTPVPAAGSIGASQSEIIPAVFPEGAVAFLGIPQPTVPVGERVYTVLSTSAAPGTPAKGADQAHSAAAFTAAVLSPARIQASLFFAREDRARLAGLNEALRANLSEALGDELDQQVLTGTNGLLTGTVLANNAASAEDTFATYRSRFAFGLVDGRYAMTASALRLLVGSETLSHMSSVYRGNSSDLDALASLVAATGGVRVSANMTAVSGDKQNAVIRRGGRQDAVVAIWEGVSLITDEVTQAKAGEIIVTAVMLYAFKVLRADGFRKVEAQHA